MLKLHFGHASLVSLFFPALALAAPLKVGDVAPDFSAKNQEGKDFHLADRHGKGWTVLYFYPKAETPGCTKQACAFRDSIDLIHAQKAEVYGISTDTVEDQFKFHEHHKLKFDLIADPEAKVVRLYEVKMPVLNLAKRWTFLVDSDLKIRWINDHVDPVMDAKMVAEKIKELQPQTAKP